MVIDEQDAILYLARRFGFPHQRMKRIFNQGEVFKGNSPYQMVRDLELASVLFYSYKALEKDSEKRRRLATVKLPPLKTYQHFELKIMIGSKEHFFQTKKEIIAFLGKRYGIKPGSMYRRIHTLCIFWTNDVLQIIQDIKRADAYTGAYMDQNYHYVQSDYKKRQQRLKKGETNMSALDGNDHTTSLEDLQADLQKLARPQPPAPRQKVAPAYSLNLAKEEREFVRQMASLLSVTPETVRRQYKKGVFDKAPEYYVAHPETLFSEYKAYKEAFELNRQKRMYELHERQRRGEISFHKQDDNGVRINPSRRKPNTIDAGEKAIDKHIEGLNKMKERNLERIEETKETIRYLEEQNTYLNQQIAHHVESKKVLEEARRVMDAFK